MHGKIENIQALRGVAALAVFGAHLQQAETAYSGAMLTPEWLQIGVTGVDLFFLISGYVMMHVTTNSTRGPGPSIQFLFNRAARIYPMYWIATLALVILYMGKKYLFGENTSLGSPIASFFLAPHDYPPILPVGWTLVHEMYFYLVFAGILLAPVRFVPAFLLIWAGVIVAAIAVGAEHLNAGAAISFSPLTFEFIGGCAIALLVQRGVSHAALSSLIIGSMALIVLTFGFFDQLYPTAMENSGWRAALFGPAYGLILYGAVSLENSGRGIAPQWLVKTGDASYALYLVHIPVVLVIGKILSTTGESGWVFSLFLLTACTAATLAATFCAHLYLERPSLRLARKLSERLFSRPAQTKVKPNRAW